MVGLYFCEVSVNAAPSLYQVVPDVPDNKKLAVSLTSEGAVGMAYFFICMESDEITHPKLSVLVTKIVKLSEKYFVALFKVSIFPPKYHLSLSPLYMFVIDSFKLSFEQNFKSVVLNWGLIKYIGLQKIFCLMSLKLLLRKGHIDNNLFQ